WEELIDKSVYSALSPIADSCPPPSLVRAEIVNEAVKSASLRANTINKQLRCEVELGSENEAILKISEQQRQLGELESKYQLIKQTYREVLGLYENSRTHARELEKARNAFEQAYRTDERQRIELEKQVAALNEKVRELDHSLENKERVLQNIKSSRSWKICN